MTEFRIARVVDRAFSVIGRNFPAFFAIALVINVPVVIMSYPGMREDTYEFDFILEVAYQFVSVFCGYLAIAAVTGVVLRDLHGGRTGFAACLTEAWTQTVRFGHLAVVTSAIVVLGLIALVIPGLFLSVVLLFALPVAVAERPGPGILASLYRSSALTEGYRWQVFAFLVVLLLVLHLPVVLGVILIVFIEDNWNPGLATEAAIILILGVSVALGSVIEAVAAVVGYHDLRLTKEGLSSADLGEVFN